MKVILGNKQIRHATKNVMLSLYSQAYFKRLSSPSNYLTITATVKELAVITKLHRNTIYKALNELKIKYSYSILKYYFKLLFEYSLNGPLMLRRS